jgi:hypothetical protein
MTVSCDCSQNWVEQWCSAGKSTKWYWVNKYCFFVSSLCTLSLSDFLTNRLRKSAVLNSVLEWTMKDECPFHISDIVEEKFLYTLPYVQEVNVGVDCMYHLALHIWICLQVVGRLFRISLDVCHCYICRTINWVSTWKLKMIYPLSWSPTCIWLVAVSVNDFGCDSCMKRTGRH